MGERDEVLRAYDRFIEAVLGDLSMLAEAVDPATYRGVCVGVTPGWVGFDEAKRSFAPIRAALPDLAFRYDTFVDGPTVVARGTLSGTNAGPLFGAPPTGRSVSFAAVDVARVAGGKVAERWFLADLLSLMRQLGLAPAGGSAGRAEGATTP